MGREHRIAFGARIETRRRRERAPFRAPGKVDDFDRAFATCPTKLTCALFPLLFSLLPLPQSSSVETNVQRIYQRKMDIFFFRIYVEVVSNYNVD